MAILCIETSEVLKTTCTLEEQQARFLYMLSTDQPQIFQLYFEVPDSST